MNAEEAREIITKRNYSDSSVYFCADGYMECYEKAKGLVEALKNTIQPGEIDNDRVRALAKWEKDS